MAKKRMFNNEVLDTDAFLDMPLSAQALYFHLNLRADDDGFISNPKRVQAYIGASEDDLKILVMKRFVIVFDDGVIVIKHWRMHNTIQKDRYIPTHYQEDLAMLGIKENKSYTTDVSKMDTKCFQNVSTDLDIDIDKDIDKEKDIKNAEIEDFYNSIWKLYPNKKGKGAVSNTQKMKLFKIGYEELNRCVERYCEWYRSKHTDETYMMYGSTFFNSGYVDYLDCNYCDGKEENNEVKDNGRQ